MCLYEENLLGESKSKFLFLLCGSLPYQELQEPVFCFGFLTDFSAFSGTFCHKLARFLLLSHHSLQAPLKCSPRPSSFIKA